MKFQVKMNWWCRFGIHSWTGWKETKLKVSKPVTVSMPPGYNYSGPSTMTVTEAYQKRECLECGRIQTRRLYEC